MKGILSSKKRCNMNWNPVSNAHDHRFLGPQVCYKDLVTMSYDNSFALVEGAKSPQWIGLRETFNETDAPWSAWANGDPITFQNWYPVKPPPPVVNPAPLSLLPPLILERLL